MTHSLGALDEVVEPRLRSGNPGAPRKLRDAVERSKLPPTEFKATPVAADSVEAEAAAARLLRAAQREQQKAELLKTRNELYEWNRSLERQFRLSGTDHDGQAQHAV